MATSYNYTISGDFTNATQVDSAALQTIIDGNATVSVNTDYINQTGDNVTIFFPSALSAGQKTELDSVVDAYTYVDIKSRVSDTFEAVVSNNSNYPGDYTSIAAAFSDGANSVYVKNGVYFETSDIDIPDGGQLIGEACAKVIIYFIGACSVKIDGSGGISETSGTIAVTSGSNQITGTSTLFTNSSVGEFVLLGTNYFEIKSIESNTSLTISNTYKGAPLNGFNCCAQAMYTGNKIENLLITNSSSVGLYVRGVRHGGIKSIAVGSCGSNVELIDSGDMSIVELISSNSGGAGVKIENCMSMSFNTLNILNSDSHGIYFTGTGVNNVIESSATENNGGFGYCISDSTKSISISDNVIRFNNGGGVDIGVNTNAISVNTCTISDNNLNGINTAGDNTVISGCFINDNSAIGVLCGISSILEGNHITDNGTIGIQIPSSKDNCVVDGNKVRNNGIIGLDIIGNQTTVEGNVIINNGGNGINVAGNDCIISDTICVGNGGKGIYVTGDDNIISSNRVKTSTGSGVEVHTGATDNIVSSNNIKNNTGADYVDNGTSTLASSNKT